MLCSALSQLTGGKLHCSSVPWPAQPCVGTVVPSPVTDRKSSEGKSLRNLFLSTRVSFKLLNAPRKCSQACISILILDNKRSRSLKYLEGHPAVLIILYFSANY